MPHRRIHRHRISHRKYAVPLAYFLIVTALIVICWPLLKAAAPVPVNPSAIASSPVSLNLTPQEQAWLRQHPQIRVGMDPSWPPYSYYSHDDRMVGMDVDFLQILQQRLGITFVQISGQNWSEVYAKIKTHEIDMLASVALTPERRAVLNFTGSYVEFPVGIITREDAPFMIGFPALEGHIVAAPRDYAPTLLLQRDYPKVQLIITDNLAEALRLVSKGKAFAILDNLPSANYLIKDQGLSNLKVAGITSYQFALRYGVRKDWPELPGILDKALASISDQERESLKDKWISLNVENLVASNEHQKVLFICLSVVAVVILIVLAWNWTLTREVARRYQVERELREARNKAVDANQMKSAFLANLSHEIRNPLNALLGFTELLKQEAGEARLQKYVDAIDAGGRTLLGVINDVLDLSKVEAGRLEIHPVPVDLGMVLRETHALFAQRAAQKGIEFVREIDAGVPSFLILDELRIRQVLYNSVSNAIKFTEQGAVRLSASFTLDNPGQATGTLILKVMDTGVGIPPEDHGRIFEPFAQREGQSPLLGGTGLGLAISKRLTELMGGRIELESQVGSGTTFRFVFPLISVTSMETRKPAQKVGDLADFKPLKVLVIDDLESNRELLKEYFQRAGHVVWDAVDAEQGIVLAQTHRPDLILLDFRLPGINGREAARQLRANPITADILVIFLSGSIRVAFEISDDPDFIMLAKPLAYAELVATLRRHLPHAVKTV